RPQARFDQSVDLLVDVVAVVDVGSRVEIQLVRVTRVRHPGRVKVENHRFASLGDSVVERRRWNLVQGNFYSDVAERSLVENRDQLLHRVARVVAQRGLEPLLEASLA